MKKLLLSSAMSALGVSAAFAGGGLDRSGQSIAFIFEDPGTAAFSVGRVNPDVTGTDSLGNSYDVGKSYTQTSAYGVFKGTEELSFGILYDQPFGADVLYNNAPGTSALGGTKAAIDSDALSFVGKYQLNENVSVFGGLRAQRISALISLNGQAYAQIGRNAISAALPDQVRAQVAANPATAAFVALVTDERVLAVVSGDAARAATASTEIIEGIVTASGARGTPFEAATRAGATAQVNGLVSATQTNFTNALNGYLNAGGYEVEVEDDWAAGWSLGAAYEVPDIALRLAVTYHSEVDHTTNSTERFGGLATFSDDLEIVSPQSVNIEFQSGIAQDTLLTGGVRWTNWGDFDVIPTQLGVDLADLDDVYRWSLGVARRFNDQLAGSFGMTYEASEGSDNVSPLGPNDGQFGVTLGMRYQSDDVIVSGGLNYTWLGNADAGVGGVDVASFDDNSALGFGLRVSYSF